MIKHTIFVPLCMSELWTAYDGVYTPPCEDFPRSVSPRRFPTFGISTVGIVPVPKRSAFETPHEELSEDVSFGIGTLLVGCREIELLGKPPQGCVRGCDTHRRFAICTSTSELRTTSCTHTRTACMQPPPELHSCQIFVPLNNERAMSVGPS